MPKYYKKDNKNQMSEQFIKTQTRKSVTASAGVQAIIESPSGSYKVENLDKWWFFHPDNSDNYLSVDDDGNYIFEIKEPRLLSRLRGTGIFKQLKRLIQIPPNRQNSNNNLIPESKFHVGMVEHFPKWYFCESCERFKPIIQWWEGWNDVLRNDEGITDSNKIRERFIYGSKGKSQGRPNCYHCYKDSIIKEGKKGTYRRQYKKLEQVRFVFVSPDGGIKDIDWSKWITAERVGKETENIEDENLESGRYNLGKVPCCDNPSLLYKRSTKLSDLVGITIECENCRKKKTLGGFFNLRKLKCKVQDKENPEKTYPIFYKPLIRTSNSVYYPIVMNSLYIPQPESKLSKDDEITIRNAQNRGLTPEKIAEALGYNLNDIRQLLGENICPSENEFRKNEYHYLITNSSVNSPNLVFEETELSKDLLSCGFDKILKIKRLKLTTVQTGYTRLRPMDSDVFARGEDKSIKFDNKDVPLKARFTVSNPNETEYLAGVENFGEGIFIKFNDIKIRQFIQKLLLNNEWLNRVQQLNDRINQNDMISKNKFSNLEHLINMLFLHSFSHLIIKELEFICGYPSSSISERIYCDEETMNGVLIYTIAGNEGSFGGLIRQSESDSFIKLLQSSLIRAKDCSSDPICYESEGQGVGGLNYAACYSCLLISETSCEEFNSFLDRKILVDSDNGFFSPFIKIV